MGTPSRCAYSGSRRTEDGHQPALRPPEDLRRLGERAHQGTLVRAPGEYCAGLYWQREAPASLPAEVPTTSFLQEYRCLLRFASMGPPLLARGAEISDSFYVWPGFYGSYAAGGSGGSFRTIAGGADGAGFPQSTARIKGNRSPCSVSQVQTWTGFSQAYTRA